jgi:hypothetical protein
MDGAMMKFSFGIRHTTCGCTVWMQSPSGRKTEAKFRNGYASALASAEKWVWEQRQSITQEASISGRQVEFDVPEELDRSRDTKRITLPVALWQEIQAKAGSEGMGLSEWIGNTAAETLLRERHAQ